MRFFWGLLAWPRLDSPRNSGLNAPIDRSWGRLLTSGSNSGHALLFSSTAPQNQPFRAPSAVQPWPLWHPPGGAGCRKGEKAVSLSPGGRSSGRPLRTGIRLRGLALRVGKGFDTPGPNPACPSYRQRLASLKQTPSRNCTLQSHVGSTPASKPRACQCKGDVCQNA